MNCKEYSEIFKALGDETRIEIVKMLTKEKLCACNILEKFQITQPTLSFHMKKLTDSKIVNFEKIGKWMHYEINLSILKKVNEFLESLTGETNGIN